MAVTTSFFSLDAAEWARIERKFQEKRRLAKAREHRLFTVLEEARTEEELRALIFLFAYMPLIDLADGDGTFYLNHVRASLNIRKVMPWGSRVPDRLFLHYVLPYRVNTENIDDSRLALYERLAPRTKGLSMTDAVLETNYWCHEQATYAGSDPRTLSPLAVIRAARGRCGEESMLAVAALRSIGIPARQVYTPRWAHCDDNHAWVEAWADGEWHDFGACEPEIRLNRGWFHAPAQRAMLIHARVYGEYPGPEPVVTAGRNLTEIHLLGRYAPTRKAAVVVKDEAGRPVGGAAVYFQLYNMGEFATIAALTTDERGEAALQTGFGDVLVRAVKDGRWCETRIGAQAEGPVEMVLQAAVQPEGTCEFDMAPPPEGKAGEADSAATEEETARHRRRLEEGAAHRQNLEKSFIGEAEASALAASLSLPAERVWTVLGKARGNGREIAAFLRERAPQYDEWPLKLLESLNDKDLIDTFRPVLDDHLIGALALRDGGAEEFPDDVFVQYILRPRIHYEKIVPYKRYFQTAFPEAVARAIRRDPSVLAEMIDNRWTLRDDEPHLRGRGNPVGTFELKTGDPVSLDILFVAICRSLGIAARLDPNEHRPQYMADGKWETAPFARYATSGAPSRARHRQRGRLRLLRDPEAGPDAPSAAYYGNFTFARLEHGVYKTIAYPYGKSDVYDEPWEVEPGNYRLTTGVRLKDGTVKVRFAYFTVSAGEWTEVPLTFREASEEIPVLGTVDRRRVLALPDGAERSLEALAGPRAAVIAWVDADREPSQHFIRELREQADDIAELALTVILAVDVGQRAQALADDARRLPPGTLIVRDPELAFLQHVWSACGDDGGAGAVREGGGETAADNAGASSSGNGDGSISRIGNGEVFAGGNGWAADLGGGYPHVAVADERGRIRYRHSGYKPGTVKEALRAAKGIRRAPS